MPHHDGRYARVSYLEDLDAARVEWRRPARGDDFRAVLDAVLGLLREERAAHWLADLRELGTIHPDDQAWSSDDWFPRALETNLSHVAIVQSEQFVDKLSVENVMAAVPEGALARHYFEDEQAAREWLREQSPSTPAA